VAWPTLAFRGCHGNLLPRQKKTRRPNPTQKKTKKHSLISHQVAVHMMVAALHATLVLIVVSGIHGIEWGEGEFSKVDPCRAYESCTLSGITSSVVRFLVPSLIFLITQKAPHVPMLIINELICL
jgi:hypothetical protein